MQRFKLPAPAKLNRFLHILNRRADGYHELQTVFQLLDLADSLTFEAIDTGIDVVMKNTDIEDTIVNRAARLLQAGRDLPGVRITVAKKVPIGAGLGGGSSDAATALHGLNVFWDLGCSNDELATMALQLGADVPVFVRGLTSFGEGIGELLTPIELPEVWYAVLVPSCRVSTVEIFSHPDLTRDSSAITIARFLEQPLLGNDCERVAIALYPEIGAALDWLSQWGAARMTGTGAAVFLQTTDETSAREVCRRADWPGFATRGTKQSVLVDAVRIINQRR